MSKSRLSKIPSTRFKKGTLKPLTALRQDLRELIRRAIEDIPTKAGNKTFRKQVVDVDVHKHSGYTSISVMVCAEMSSSRGTDHVREQLEGALMGGFYMIHLSPVYFSQRSQLTVIKLCPVATCVNSLPKVSLNENGSTPQEAEAEGGGEGSAYEEVVPSRKDAGDDSPQSRTHHHPFLRRDDGDDIDDDSHRRTHHSQ